MSPFYGTPIVRWSGWALVGGGLAVALSNAAFTPFLPMGVSFAEIAASPVFLWRQSASVVAMVLVLVGTLGVHLRQAERAGIGSTLAFLAAMLGSALLLAWEWVDVFVLRPLAFAAPAALTALEDRPGIDLFDMGALIPICAFSLGWIALAGVTVRARVLPRAAAWLVIAGFFATPLFSALLSPRWGGVLGAAVLGAGFIGLGRAVARPE